MICQWINHCPRKAEYFVAIYNDELPVCGPCVREYGLNDGDIWAIHEEDDK